MMRMDGRPPYARYVEVGVDDDSASEVRWLAMLIRQACLMIAKGIERRYAVGEYRNQQ